MVGSTSMVGTRGWAQQGWRRGAWQQWLPWVALLARALAASGCTSSSPPTYWALGAQEAFPGFFQRVLTLKAEHPGMRMHERVAYLVFVINTFQVRGVGVGWGGVSGQGCASVCALVLVWMCLCSKV